MGEGRIRNFTEDTKAFLLEQVEEKDESWRVQFPQLSGALDAGLTADLLEPWGEMYRFREQIALSNEQDTQSIKSVWERVEEIDRTFGQRFRELQELSETYNKKIQLVADMLQTDENGCCKNLEVTPTEFLGKFKEINEEIEAQKIKYELEKLIKRDAMGIMIGLNEAALEEQMEKLYSKDGKSCDEINPYMLIAMARCLTFGKCHDGGKSVEAIKGELEKRFQESSLPYEMKKRYKEAIKIVMSNLTNNPEIIKYLKNLENNNLNLSPDKQQSIYVMAEILLNEGFEVTFVVGILGNIVVEGSAGIFESSNYTSNPSAEPQYLKYMDEKYNYENIFSGKSISEIGVSKTYQILKNLEVEEYQGKFGLGCAQWTGSRTMDLIECYIEICGKNEYPTTEQCLQAESLFIARELKGNYSEVYQNWKNTCSDVNPYESAESAGKIVCQQYEKPRIDTSKERGEIAIKIYEEMTND